MQNLSGQKLGNYELRERLGRGGMAEVYRAYQAGMDRDVAVKVMLGHLADDDNFVERFKREARAVGRLRHPHIVDIFDFGIGDDVYYMVMEYLTDGNLKKYIDERGHLSLTESLKITRDLADALNYAHKSGMIHRDLKPANIMFMDKRTHDVVLTDFGIARILNATSLTGTGMSVGTPAYISPEVASGETADERADIYALGIILYEMLTGEVPYNADTPLAVIMKHINAPLPTRDDYGDMIPADVEKIILQCLAKDPNARFASAAALRDALTVVLNSHTDTDSMASVANATDVAGHRGKDLTTVTDDDKTRQGASADKMTVAMDVSPSKNVKGPRWMRWSALLIALVLIAGVAYVLFDRVVTTSDTDTETVIDVTSETIATEVDPTPVPDDDIVSFDVEIFEPQFDGDLPPNPAENLSMYSNISEILNEAESLVFVGDVDGAIAQVEAILADDPTNADALFAKARLYSYRWDDANIAGETAQQLIDLDSDSPWGYIALADSFLNYPLLDEDGSVDAAREAIQRAIDLAPENPHAIWRWASLSDWELQPERYLRAEELGASGADFIFSMGTYFSEMRDYRRALPYWESYYRNGHPESWNWSESFWMLMEALIWSGQAQAGYELLLESPFPDIASDAQTFSNMAFIAFMPGEYEQAEDWATAALAFSSDGDANAARWVLAYMAFEVDGDADSAVEQLIDLAATDAYHRYLEYGVQEDAYLQSARYMVMAGRDEEAIDLYNTLLEINSGIPHFYEERADTYLRLGETELARQDLLAALALEPDPGVQQFYRDRIIELGPAENDDS